MAVIELSDPATRRNLAIASGCVLVAGVFAIYSLAGGEKAVSAADAKAFYTVDNGASTFADKALLVPPFDHEGKPAVQAVVFTSDGGKTKTIGYLRRLNAEAKKTITANPKTLITPNSFEVSKPGAAPAWSPANSAAGMAIVHTAATSGANVEEVTP